MISPGPLVSVLIPCYNVSPYVEKAIYSIINQTYENLEILIIDDASADDTLLKIKSIKDHRVKILEFKENTKKVGAVNSALKIVKGNFICFQDADDWSEPTRIEQQIEQFDKQADLGICFTGYRYVGDKKGLPGRIALINEELREEFLQFGHAKNVDFYPTNCPTMMISKEALQKTGGYHNYFAGRVAEDIHWIYCILKEFKGITIDRVLYNYSIREGSFTQLQFSGTNAKYAYSWQLLTRIIYKDIHENIDVLSDKNVHILKEIELVACEEALVENIKLVNSTKNIYENSWSFKLGKLLLTPFRLFKND